MFLKTRWFSNTSSSSITLCQVQKQNKDRKLPLIKQMDPCPFISHCDHRSLTSREEETGPHCGTPTGHQPLSGHIAPSASFATPTNATRKAWVACPTSRRLRKIGDLLQMSQQFGRWISTWTQTCPDSKAHALATTSHHFSRKKQKWDMGQRATSASFGHLLYARPCATYLTNIIWFYPHKDLLFLREGNL